MLLWKPSVIMMFVFLAAAAASAATTIAIQSPTNNGIVNSPMHVSATAGGANAIVDMQVYVDGTLKASSQSGSLSADISLLSGNHSVVVYATDSTGLRVSQTLAVQCVILSMISQHSVLLSWNASTSSVMGYYIYRGPSANGPFTRLNSDVEPATLYTDHSVSAGQTYYYVVTSVDANTESGYSAPIRASVPFD